MGWIVPSGGKQLSVFLPAGEYSLRFNANNSSFIHNGSGNMGLPNFTFDGRIGFNHLVTGVYSGKFFHTSFEEDVNSNSTHAYTGKYSHYGTYQINLESPAPGDYILEYWIYNTGLQSWEHKEEPVSLTSSGSFSKTIGQSNRYIDEIRFYPVHAQITTYTYEPLVGMTSMTDVSGRKTTYDYDDFNRLEFIRDDKEMLLQENKYHYKN
ncbi:YD repeat-containing protein [Sinomicrobium oceani]|uniref:YD repeat-containing protein n=1 Tax=Sinomicrobium oceani TaxID=1150368 RepID=A0A1K1S0K0_9FLAO|nr:RHS repeat domain-containing protein [Sinomicrobium oceani]SFW77615.1 YD repeat-containing protein [Sinomicrobium oceani]